MDTADRIATFEQAYRIQFEARADEPDVEGLQELITALTTAASNEVVITGQSFEGGQSTGTLTNEAAIRLRAAMNVLAEIDPDNTPSERPNYAFARVRPPMTDAGSE
jgi:hypothetical protein